MDVLNPNSPAVYHVGDTLDIRWSLDTTVISRISGLVYSLSTDDGLAFIPLGLVLPTDEAFKRSAVSFLITDSIFDQNSLQNVSLIGERCRIDIHEYWNSDIRDQSEASFAIRPSSAAVVRSVGNRRNDVVTGGSDGPDPGPCGAGAGLAMIGPLAIRIRSRRKWRLGT